MTPARHVDLALGEQPLHDHSVAGTRRAGAARCRRQKVTMSRRCWSRAASRARRDAERRRDLADAQLARGSAGAGRQAWHQRRLG